MIEEKDRSVAHLAALEGRMGETVYSALGETYSAPRSSPSPPKSLTSGRGEIGKPSIGNSRRVGMF